MITSLDTTCGKYFVILMIFFSFSCSDEKGLKDSQRKRRIQQIDSCLTRIILSETDTGSTFWTFPRYQSDSMSIHYAYIEATIMWDEILNELDSSLNYNYDPRPDSITYITLYFSESTDTLKIDSLIACQVYLLAHDGTSHHRLFVKHSDNFKLQDEMSCESFPYPVYSFIKRKYLNTLKEEEHLSIYHLSTPYELDYNKELYTYYGLLRFNNFTED